MSATCAVAGPFTLWEYLSGPVRRLVDTATYSTPEAARAALLETLGPRANVLDEEREGDGYTCFAIATSRLEVRVFLIEPAE